MLSTRCSIQGSQVLTLPFPFPILSVKKKNGGQTHSFFYILTVSTRRVCENSGNNKIGFASIEL